MLGPRDAPLRFALRMGAMAVVAAAVALAPPEATFRALRALGLIAGLVAVLAVAEVAGVPLDAWLDRFRDSAAVVGAERRATAGSAHPNLAGAFLAYGLVAGTAASSAIARPLRWALPFAALLVLGLLATYSRGALLAAAVGLLVLALRTRRAAAWAALAVLVAGGAAALLAPAVRLRAGGEGTVSWYAVAAGPTTSASCCAPASSAR